MYQVKMRGKSNVMVYTPALDIERQRRQDIEDDIEDGIKRGEFEVEYQPIVDAASRETVAVEALLRWPRRPDGPIGPDVFIPIAESSGLIHALGQFVLRRACEDFRDRDGIKLSVNVSPAQFRDPGFETRIADILTETGFPAERLELELTEGYLIHHPARATAAINALNAMGISVALDDFGTGYTSIAYLQNYGFRRIKIDKSLVDGIGIDHKAGVLISGIVFLAQGLDLAVTAEGVESEEQAALLRLAGCHCLQGFHFGRAQASDRFLPAVAAASQAG
jgi:EAL domain-containing protein (putative c-di-GMP-specific phosphodiesterase class I)